MAEPTEKKCDIDDLLCQVQVLGHLRGMKGVLGEEGFASKFPEFQGLSEKLTERVAEQEITVRDAMERCDLPGTSPLEPEPQAEAPAEEE